MNLPNGEINVLREGVDENDTPWQQNQNIQISDFANGEEVTPNWAALRDALGVSSQAKAQNVAAYALSLILGVE